MSAQTPYILLGISLVGLTLILRHEAQGQADKASGPETVLAAKTSEAPAEEPALEPAKAVIAPPDESAPPQSKPLLDFGRMADGTMVPPLPPGAPPKVRIGVALFRYRGAQGAAPTDRSREEAQALAERATEAAQAGFRRAIAQADPGSNEDIGWVKRGVLERRVEHDIFLLAPGTTSEKPIETPRGFWVVRRIR